MSALALTLYRALEEHRQRMAEVFDRRAEQLGVLRYRRQVAVLNRNRIVVVAEGRYSIFTLAEFAKIAGFELA